jgi:hypothetical protein
LEQSNTPTPGPWTWVRVLIEEERPEHYISLGHDRSAETDTAVIDLDEDEHGCNRMLIENPADARLIASAPNLLASLTWAVEWMENYEGECMPEWREWQQGARAVLDAAKGEQP